jgi:hypothetical protein
MRLPFTSDVFENLEIDELIKSGFSNHKDGEYREAIRLFTTDVFETLEIDELIKSGRSKHKDGEYGEAISIFNKALALCQSQVTIISIFSNNRHIIFYCFISAN